MPDGKLLIGGAHSFGYLFRVNTDGTKDTTFESPTLIYSLSTMIQPRISDFDLQADGKIPFVGAFTSANGIEKNSFGRLNTDGSLDLSFSPNPSFPGQSFRTLLRIAVQPDQKIIIKGGFTTGGLARFNQDGTIDNTFVTSVGSFIDMDDDGKILFTTTAGYARLNADGSPDTTFITLPLKIAGTIGSLAIQNDGKILAAGDFSELNNIAVNKFARLNSDGTVDTFFNSGSGPDVAPSGIIVQPDGKIIIRGSFTNYNGVPVQKIARLSSDGSLDTSFTVLTNATIDVVAIQPDGKILIGGSFTSVNNLVRNSVVRLNSDGSLDNTFTVVVGSSSIIRSIIIQPDGKIVIGGGFSGVNGIARAKIARLNADGSTDASFNAGSITAVVNQIIRQPDGKYLIRSDQIFRRNSDGSVDNSFQPTNILTAGDTPFLAQMLLRSDGSVIVVGSFDRVNDAQRKNIARFASTGNLDTLFLPSGADNFVAAIVEQTNGKTVAGGGFKTIGNVNRNGIARIENVQVSNVNNATPFDFDGDGKADFTVYRSSNNVWYQLLGGTYQFAATHFGSSGDLLIPADYDGDGKYDLAVFRQSSGEWIYAGSASGNNGFVMRWGQNGDVPLPADFDGDGKADFIVYRPSTRTWYRYGSLSGQFSFVVFGAAGDIPLIGDYDGDGKSDPAVFRPSTNEWFYAASSQNGRHLRTALWGVNTDKLVPADYDGDGKTDAAIFRDGLWAVYNSRNGSHTLLTFGQAGDTPVAADYDGDGKADFAVYRPADGNWYLLRSAQGFSAINFGVGSDIPIPNVYVR